MPDIYTLAGQAYAALETATRPDGTTFTRTKDDAPEWVEWLVREAHGSFLPDDWRYEAVRSALGWIHDNEPDMDAAHEWADSYVDVYTMARLAWLSSHLQRQVYVDEAASEFGHDPEAGIAAAIGLGQYMEAREVFEAVAQALTEQADEIESRLEYLRGELRAERISYGEIAELQSLTEYIPACDLELREAAGLPETED